MPPPPDALDRKSSCIVIDANIYPTRIGGNVIDAIGCNLTQFRYFEVMNADWLRVALRTQFAAAIFEIADQLLLFTINRDDGLRRPLELFYPCIDVFELLIAIGM